MAKKTLTIVSTILITITIVITMIKDNTNLTTSTFPELLEMAWPSRQP